MKCRTPKLKRGRTCPLSGIDKLCIDWDLRGASLADLPDVLASEVAGARTLKLGRSRGQPKTWQGPGYSAYFTSDHGVMLGVREGGARVQIGGMGCATYNLSNLYNAIRDLFSDYGIELRSEQVSELHVFADLDEVSIDELYDACEQNSLQCRASLDRWRSRANGRTTGVIFGSHKKAISACFYDKQHEASKRERSRAILKLRYPHGGAPRFRYEVKMRAAYLNRQKIHTYSDLLSRDQALTRSFLHYVRLLDRPRGQTKINLPCSKWEIFERRLSRWASDFTAPRWTSTAQSVDRENEIHQSVKIAAGILRSTIKRHYPLSSFPLGEAVSDFVSRVKAELRREPPSRS